MAPVWLRVESQAGRRKLVCWTHCTGGCGFWKLISTHQYFAPRPPRYQYSGVEERGRWSKQKQNLWKILGGVQVCQYIDLGIDLEYILFHTMQSVGQSNCLPEVVLKWYRQQFLITSVCLAVNSRGRQTFALLRETQMGWNWDKKTLKFFKRRNGT